MDVNKEPDSPVVEADNSDATESEKEHNGQLDIGAMLVEARENQNLTAQDIADQMNLTLAVISKIENNEFEQDLPLAFVRGYVRSYAKKVGVDVENICVEFDRQTGSKGEPLQSVNVVSSYKIKRKEINSNSSIFKVITFIIVVSVVAFATWELWKKFQRDQQDQTETNVIELNADNSAAGFSKENTSKANSLQNATQENASSQPLEINLQSSDTSDTDAAQKNISQADSNRSNADSSETDSSETANSEANLQQSSSSNNASELNLQSAEEAQRSLQSQLQADANTASSQDAQVVSISEDTEQAASQKLTGPINQLNFIFSADCWVQVTDANGEVIAVGIKRTGKVMPIEGVAPFQVILGEPSAVSLAVNGEEYDLSRFVPGRRAKFTIN